VYECLSGQTGFIGKLKQLYNQLADVILLVEVHYPAHHLDYLGHMVGLLGMLVMLKCQTPTT
jgi:hypothetical protein